MKKPKVLLIGGPTGVGKTSLSLKCAKEFNGEIISADSVQIYKELNIGSAKIKKSEMQKVPHHLIDELDATKSFDVDAFRKKANELIIKLNNEGKLPIIVGGTGFYMRALLFPYSLGNTQKDEKLRAKYEKLAREKGNEFLHSLLEKVDKKSAEKLHFNDVKRVIRALEIYHLTGKKKSDQTLNFTSPYDYTLIVLNEDRKVLYNNINARVDKMFKEGLLAEATYLIKEKKLPKHLQSMSGIGYREFYDYFNDILTLEEVKEKIKKDTRNYAKRQFTYFKTMPDAKWFNKADGLQPIINYLKKQFEGY